MQKKIMLKKVIRENRQLKEAFEMPQMKSKGAEEWLNLILRSRLFIKMKPIIEKAKEKYEKRGHLMTIKIKKAEDIGAYNDKAPILSFIFGDPKEEQMNASFFILDKDYNTFPENIEKLNSLNPKEVFDGMEEIGFQAMWEDQKYDGMEKEFTQYINKL